MKPFLKQTGHSDISGIYGRNAAGTLLKTAAFGLLGWPSFQAYSRMAFWISVVDSGCPAAINNVRGGEEWRPIGDMWRRRFISAALSRAMTNERRPRMMSRGFSIAGAFQLLRSAQLDSSVFLATFRLYT